MIFMKDGKRQRKSPHISCSSVFENKTDSKYHPISPEGGLHKCDGCSHGRQMPASENSDTEQLEKNCKFSGMFGSSGGLGDMVVRFQKDC